MDAPSDDSTARQGALSLSVVFSFRNEEDVLGELLRRSRETLDAEVERGRLSRFEFVFVDDDSTDGSAALLRREADEHGDIRLISMSRCFGVSPCVMAGLRHATGDAVVYMDADLQDPPELIPELLDAFCADGEVEVVHTRRLSREGESSLKLAITHLGYSILHHTSSIDLPMHTGDFKLLSRRAVRHLLSFGEKRPFMRGLVCWIGFKQTAVTYDRAPRAAGETKFPVLSLSVISNFFESALVSFSSAPLHLASLAGLCSAGVGFLVLVHVLIEKSLGHNLPGWTATMVATLFLGSIQLMSLGIIGIYIASIFDESKKRPNYIVKDAYGFPAGVDPTRIRPESGPTDGGEA